jgi:hypothetical protein
MGFCSKAIFQLASSFCGNREVNTHQLELFLELADQLTGGLEIARLKANLRSPPPAFQFAARGQRTAIDGPSALIATAGFLLAKRRSLFLGRRWLRSLTAERDGRVLVT